MDFRLEKLPVDILGEILQYLSEEQICALCQLSTAWNRICSSDALWKRLFQRSFPHLADVTEHGKPAPTSEIISEILRFQLDKTFTWKSCFLMVAEHENQMCWDDSHTTQVHIADHGRQARHHGPGVYYMAFRTNIGYIKGKHAWQIRMDAVTCNAYNIYVGVAIKKLASNNHLGADKTSWALRGGDGCYYHNNNHTEYGLPFRNRATVGVILDMDNYTLCFAVDGVMQNVLEIPEFAGLEVFPAVSLIEETDVISARFNIPPSELLKSQPEFFSTRRFTWKSREDPKRRRAPSLPASKLDHDKDKPRSKSVSGPNNSPVQKESRCRVM